MLGRLALPTLCGLEGSVRAPSNIGASQGVFDGVLTLRRREWVPAQTRAGPAGGRGDLPGGRLGPGWMRHLVAQLKSRDRFAVGEPCRRRGVAGCSGARQRHPPDGARARAGPRPPCGAGDAAFRRPAAAHRRGHARSVGGRNSAPRRGGQSHWRRRVAQRGLDARASGATPASGFGRPGPLGWADFGALAALPRWPGRTARAARGAWPGPRSRPNAGLDFCRPRS
jgi:hypothetical protein